MPAPLPANSPRLDPSEGRPRPDNPVPSFPPEVPQPRNAGLCAASQNATNGGLGMAAIGAGLVRVPKVAFEGVVLVGVGLTVAGAGWVGSKITCGGK